MTPICLGDGNWIRLNAIFPSPGKGERQKKTWHDSALPSHAGHDFEDAYQVPSAVAWVQLEASIRYLMQGMRFGGGSQTSINLPKYKRAPGLAWGRMLTTHAC